MQLEKKLFELSTTNEEMNRMYQRWNVIKNDVVERLNTVSIYFPHFSLHNESHSKTIAIQIGRWLGKERIDKLSFTDIFMMLMCFYMHDIGMAIRYEEINNRFQSSEFKGYVYKLATDTNSELHDIAKRLSSIDSRLSASEYDKSIDIYNDVVILIEDMYRRNHAQRSANEIRAKLNLEKDIGVRFVEILAEMCKAHQEKISNIMKLPYKSNGLFDDYMHPRFIASMLCLGDLLDLDTDRFNDTILEAVSPLPRSSKLHLEKHKSIRQFLVEPTGIEIVSNAKDIEVYRVMREWTDWIEETCNFLAINWGEIAPSEFGCAPHIKKCELLLNNNKKWAQFANMKFEISSKRALNILKGSGIYKNKFVCIREIIQNANDATLLRIFRDKITAISEDEILEELLLINWNEYEIEGEIFINDDSKVEIKIRDKGIGINEADIKKIAAVSNERDDEKNEILNKMPIWVRPSGAFGIGIQSIFLLTDKFEIVTKTSEEKAKKIIFESVQEMNGYITVEDYMGAFSEGTQVRFVVDSKKIELDDLNCAEYFYKTSPKEILILDKINQLYNNDLKDAPRIYEMEKQKFDYIPAKIQITNPSDYTNMKLLEYDAFFKKGMDFINIDNNRVYCSQFLKDNCCQIFLNIVLENNDEHKYGEIRKMYVNNYENTFFYRNVLVKHRIIEQFYLANRGLYPYVDLKINLLDKDAEAVLEINRNAIKESYENHLKHIIDDSSEQVIKKVIDKLISAPVNNIGDCIFVVYQFARQYEYKVDLIEKMYKDNFNTLKFNNYFRWDTGNEIDFSFDKLKNNHLYFIVEKVNSDEIKKCDYPELDDKKEFCLYLKKHSKNDVHILNHRVEKMFVGKLNNELVKVLEVVPFENNGNSIICDKDDLFILEDIINMLITNTRCMNSIKKYECLITPLKSTSRLLSYGWLESSGMIEIPFENDVRVSMQQELISNGYIADAKEKYYDKVINSVIFNTNIKYIQEYRLNERKVVEESYKELMEKVLELLSDNSYVLHNKKDIEWHNEHRNFRKGNYEIIEHNQYVTLSF